MEREYDNGFATAAATIHIMFHHQWGGRTSHGGAMYQAMTWSMMKWHPPPELHVEYGLGPGPGKSGNEC